MTPRKYVPPEPVPYVPSDSAEYLEGDLPRYQGDGMMDDGEGGMIDMNKLQNVFDPNANEGHTK